MFTGVRNSLLMVLLMAAAAYVVWHVVQPMLPWIIVCLVLVVGLGAIIRTWFG